MSLIWRRSKTLQYLSDNNGDVVALYTDDYIDAWMDDIIDDDLMDRIMNG